VIGVNFFSETLMMLFIFYLLRPFYPFRKLRNKRKYRKTQKKDNNSNNCIIFKFGIILLLSIFLLLGKGHDQGNLHYVKLTVNTLAFSQMEAWEGRKCPHCELIIGFFMTIAL
jgi:Na+/H+ antiporter NhaD/arsenite permease-like protein